MSDRSRTGRSAVLLFAVTIFTSAFLLFQVQPLISRFILPWFGGSPTVWSTCMLFFQVLLFGGYVYAHLITSKLTPKTQAILHASLLVLAGCLMPITPDDAWKPTGGENPTLLIVGLLSVSVGLPYFILSTTGPLLQRWFSLQVPGVSPYRLYALSNIGSLLALVSYPFVVEPALSSELQAVIWSFAFGAYALMCVGCAYGTLRLTAADNSSSLNQYAADSGSAPSWADRTMWFCLAMVASVMLLATTNQMCLDVASVPFLWILPLTVYLISFVLTFDSDSWYSRRWYVALLFVSVLAVIKTMLGGSGVSIVLQVGIYTLGLFFCCMVCHGELARQKPGPRHLTQFYVLLSAGGAAGGLFVGLIAPHVFSAYWELHIGIIGCLIVTLTVLFRDHTSYLYKGQPRPAWIAIILWVSLLAWSLQSSARDASGEAIEMTRNFYGVLTVQDQPADDGVSAQRVLMHGSIVHGEQFLDPAKRHWPTAYYGPDSGAGIALQHHRSNSPRHIGIIGLGIGTLAAYGDADDRIRFYEINPEVVRLARRYFTCLEDCPAKIDIIVGDARLSMDNEEPQEFDVLVLDAFSGDTCPTHLLTKEAGDIYRRHLNDDGLICIHISNLHFDLRPVVQGLADHMEMQVVGVEDQGDTDAGTRLCHWMVLSKEPLSGEIRSRINELKLSNEPTLWTDGWTDLISVLR